MRELEEKIIQEGKVLEGDILKVDCFLNHMVDVDFANKIGEEFHRLFGEEIVTKILTAESSGIAVAITTAQQFGNIPVIFAKKSNPKNMDTDRYQSEAMSYTRGGKVSLSVAKGYLSPEDHVLIIDDFLANGSALCALIDICDQAGVTIAGAGIVIEKAFQPGRAKAEKLGVRVCSLARIGEMNENHIEFVE